MTLVDALLVAAILCASSAAGLVFGSPAGLALAAVLLGAAWFLLGES